MLDTMLPARLVATFARIALRKTNFQRFDGNGRGAGDRPRGCSIEGCAIFLRYVESRDAPRYSILTKNQGARYNQGRSNTSLDASGTSGLVFDILSVTWLLPAASTQPLGISLIVDEPKTPILFYCRSCHRPVRWCRFSWVEGSTVRLHKPRVGFVGLIHCRWLSRLQAL